MRRVVARAIGVTMFWLVATLAESQSHMTVLFDIFSGPDFSQDFESFHVDVWKWVVTKLSRKWWYLQVKFTSTKMVLSRGFAFVIMFEYICQIILIVYTFNFTLAQTHDKGGSLCCRGYHVLVGGYFGSKSKSHDCAIWYIFWTRFLPEFWIHGTLWHLVWHLVGLCHIWLVLVILVGYTPLGLSCQYSANGMCFYPCHLFVPKWNWSPSNSTHSDIYTQM